MQTKVESMPAHAGGASEGAWQQNPSACSQVSQLIRGLYLSAALEEFVNYINELYKIEAEVGGGEAVWSAECRESVAEIRHD